MSVTDSSVERTEEVIVEDPTITLRFLALELDVRYGSAHAIAHEQLGRSKRYARWVPNQLTIEQKEQRVATGRNLLHEFEANGHQRFSDVVTGDECWINVDSCINDTSFLYGKRKCQMSMEEFTVRESCEKETSNLNVG